MKKRVKAPFRVTVCVDATKSMGHVAFQGVVEFIRKANCKWVLHSSAGNRLWLPTEIDNIPPGELDGIIGFASNDSTIARLRKAGVCWVSIFDDPPDSSIPAVLSDNNAIGHLAARHLVELQLRNFVYYGSDLVNNSEARFKGFAKFLAEHCGASGSRALPRDGRAGPLDPPWNEKQNRVDGRACRAATAADRSICAPIHIKIGAEDVMRSLSGDRGDYLRKLGSSLLAITHDGRDAVGVFAYSDNMGITVIDACREVGLTVPDKVAVIAVASDEIICELSTPPLTTILQDARKIGYESAAMLDVLLRGRALKKRRILVPPLGVNVRTSTNIFATEDPYVIKALRIMREQFSEELKMTAILNVLKISRRSFEKRFRLALGRSPYEEVTRLRIRHAEALLAQTSETIPAVSLKSGFGSERRLSENFRRLTGMSPGGYRRKFAGIE